MFTERIPARPILAAALGTVFASYTVRASRSTANSILVATSQTSDNALINRPVNIIVFCAE